MDVNYAFLLKVKMQFLIEIRILTIAKCIIGGKIGFLLKKRKLCFIIEIPL